jgi:hypothetical protein
MADRLSGGFHGGCLKNPSAFLTENLRVGSTANIRSARYCRRFTTLHPHHVQRLTYEEPPAKLTEGSLCYPHP